MAWSWLQSASTGSQTGSGTVSATYGTNLSTGSALVAVTGARGSGTVTTTGVQDGSSNSFTKIASVNPGNHAYLELSLWALAVPSGDVGTKPVITATAANATSGQSVLIQELSGLTSGSLADGTAAAMYYTLVDGLIGPPAYSSSTAGEYLLYVYCDNDAGGWTAPGSPYTTDPNSLNSTSGTTYPNVAAAYRNSTGGTESGQWTSGATASTALIMVAFSLAAAPSGQNLIMAPFV